MLLHLRSLSFDKSVLEGAEVISVYSLYTLGGRTAVNLQYTQQSRDMFR